MENTRESGKHMGEWKTHGRVENTWESGEHRRVMENTRESGEHMGELRTHGSGDWVGQYHGI